MRKKILSGEMADSGWSECSVDSMHNPQDVDAWYETNPSLGIRLQERVVRAEITTDEVDFNVQRLGYGCLIIRTHISQAEWNSGIVDVLPDVYGKLYAAVKHGHDNANVALCISLKTRAHTIFTEMIDCRR